MQLDIQEREDGTKGGIVFLCRNTNDPVNCNVSNERMRIKSKGKMNNGLRVGSIACFHNASSYAVVYNTMQSGSLTIGRTNANYGTGRPGWTDNTAGLMMECSDYTEIIVHDSSTRLASFMFYDGP